MTEEEEKELQWTREYRRKAQEQERTEKMMDAVNTLFDLLNGGGSVETKNFIAAVDRQHRTLQQKFFALTVNWLKAMADKKEGQYDARNEHSVKLAKEMVKAPSLYFSSDGRDFQMPLI